MEKENDRCRFQTRVWKGAREVRAVQGHSDKVNPHIWSLGVRYEDLDEAEKPLRFWHATSLANWDSIKQYGLWASLDLTDVTSGRLEKPKGRCHIHMVGVYSPQCECSLAWLKMAPPNLPAQKNARGIVIKQAREGIPADKWGIVEIDAWAAFNANPELQIVRAASGIFLATQFISPEALTWFVDGAGLVVYEREKMPASMRPPALARYLGSVPPFKNKTKGHDAYQADMILEEKVPQDEPMDFDAALVKNQELRPARHA
jgi:hypothetical protein